jgi:hypothetical protein
LSAKYITKQEYDNATGPVLAVVFTDGLPAVAAVNLVDPCPLPVADGGAVA